LTLSLFGINASSQKKNIIPRDAKKMILVVTTDWDSTPARIYLLENINGTWKFNGKQYTGVIGKKGFGWGIGLHNSLGWDKRFPYKDKMEGDKRSPAGLYTLSDVMGYGPELPIKTTKKYVQIHGNMHAVDDTSSIYYNQIVDTTTFADGFRNSYNSYEDLAYMGPVYKWLFIIDHNADRVRGRGSNIYFHIRNADGTGTGGCTAVTEENILEIITWLDNSTIILQLPIKVFKGVRKELHLPAIKN